MHKDEFKISSEKREHKDKVCGRKNRKRIAVASKKKYKKSFMMLLKVFVVKKLKRIMEKLHQNII